MFAPRTVCRQCASKVRLVAGRGRAASFASSSTHSPSEAPAEGARRRVRNPDMVPPSTARRRKRETGLRNQPKGHADALNVFYEVVAGPRGSSDVADQSNGLPPIIEWEVMAQVKELQERPVTARQKLDLFEKEIWPDLARTCGGRHMPKSIYKAVTHLLTRICHAAMREGPAGVALDLSKACARIGKWDLDVRGDLILGLCHSLLTLHLPTSARGSMVDELLDLWKHVSQLKRRSLVGEDLPEPAAPLRFVLPSEDEIFNVAEVQKHGPGDMTPTAKALASMFNQYSLAHAGVLVPGLLATIAILSDPRYTKLEFKIEAAPLLKLARLALSPEVPTEAALRQIFAVKARLAAAHLHELEQYVVTQWPKAWEMLVDPAAKWHEGAGDAPRRSARSSPALATWHKQLRAAYRSRNRGAMVSIWQDFRKSLVRWPDLVWQMREDPEFIDFWIFAWCAVRQPEKLQETLKLMEEIDMQPTIRSYTAMMHGWKTCRDTDKTTALWNKLVQSGVRLDVFIWTERISGLIEAGRTREGIQALAHMMAVWKRAVEAHAGDEAAAAADGAVQPNTEVVNAALKGLIQVDANSAHEVLNWAGENGIEPNVRTYNILIRESFRGNNPQQAQDLLQVMRKRGVQPDSATFTILLGEVLGAMDQASAEEQVQAVKQVLADMDTAGLRANDETFGKMLYAVASLHNGGADEAIAAVQQHMRAAGMSISPHMVTILLERSIALGRLGPGSVQALLREYGLTDVKHGDQTLWERVVSAHAALGDTPAAMAVYDALASANRPVSSLPCLKDLVHALLAAGRRDDAARVARAAMAAKVVEGPEAHGPDSRYWRHHFWHMAAAEGLLEWSEVPPELRARLRPV